MTMSSVRLTVCQMYTNLTSDDHNTWATELAEVNQIIALTTKIENIESKLRASTVALATSTANEAINGSNRRSQRDKKPSKWDWMLKKEGAEKVVDGVKYSWCEEDHWHKGVKVNGKYHAHAHGDHAGWRKKRDEEFAARKKTGSETVVNDETKKKLSLSEKLRTAMTTQAGLSNEAFTRIWAECEKDSSKE